MDVKHTKKHKMQKSIISPRAEKSGQNRYDAKKQHISIETFRRSHQSLSRKMELRHLPSTKGHQLRTVNRAPSKESRFNLPSSER